MSASRARLVVALALLGAALVGATDRAPGEELVTVATRPGVTQSFLLVRPADRPVAAVILFAGGHGNLALSAAGIGWGQGNFLVRNRQRFADQGFLVAVIDAPSDRAAEGLVRFRASREHAEDVRSVIAALRRIAEVPVWLVGTSMGTVSAANAAARLREGGANGLVLTASVTRYSRQMAESLDDVGLAAITVPTLMVHHKDDACGVTRYQDAAFTVKELRRAPRVELRAFAGGDPPRSEPCEALSAHGFLGLDAEVVAAVAAWITGATGPR